MNKVLIALLLLAIILIGCSQKEFSSFEDFEKYIYSDDYQYLTSEEKSNVRFTLRYIPTDLLLKNEYRMSNGSDEQQDNIQKLKSQYDESIYFRLQMSFIDDSDLIFNTPNYSSLLDKLVFGLKEEIYLKTNKASKVPLQIYNFERNYGLTKDRVILLSFPRVFDGEEILSSRHIELIINEFGLHTGQFRLSLKGPIKDIKLKL